MDHGFSPSYDAVNSHTVWNGPHRFYEYNDGEFVESPTQKDLMIAFVEGIIISDERWIMIRAFLNDPESDLGKKGDAFLERPKYAKTVNETEKLTESSKITAVPVETEYAFRHEEFELGYLYEVTKPNTDFPYTVWEPVKSHLNFFSSIFSVDSWGVSRTDYAFLEFAWGQLNMEGPCELEKLVAARVEACKAGDPEPRVYRKNLIDVKEMLLNRDLSIGQKRTAVTDEVYRKK